MIVVIHPIDPSTRFLRKVYSASEGELEAVFFVPRSHNNFRSNEALLKCLRSSYPFAILMGHGRSDSFMGSVGRSSSAFGFDDRCIEEAPEEYYSHGTLIDLGNIEILSGMAVLGLWCNSSDKAASFAVKAGALAFIGFGFVPSDSEEMLSIEFPTKRLNRNNEKQTGSVKMAALFRHEIVWIIRNGLEQSLRGENNIRALYDWLRFYCDYRRFRILEERKGCHLKWDLCFLIDKFRSEITLFGDPYAALI